MGIRSVAVGVCVGIVLSVASVPALAQARSAPAPAEPKANIAAMYSYEYLEANSPWGVAVDVSEKMSHLSPTTSMSAVMQFSYNHFSRGGDDIMFGGGARIGFEKPGNMTPYVHFMGALTHCCDSNWFTLLIGGGTDIKFSSTNKLKIRLEGNWVILFADGPQNGFRVNAGIVIPLGKK